MALVIRSALIDEAALVRAIMLAAFEEYRAHLVPASSAHDESLADVEQAMSRGGAVLAQLDGVTVGSGRFQLRGDHAYFERLAVLQGHRGAGIAAAMLTKMEGLAVERGHHEGRLSVRLSLPRNLALYERLGWERIATHVIERSPAHSYAEFRKSLHNPVV